MPGAERIHCLQDILKENEWAGAVLFHSRDIVYYANTAQPSYLVIRPDEYMLFVRRGYEIAVGESWLDAGRIVDERSLGKIIQTMFPGPAFPGEQIGTEMDLLTFLQAGALNRALNGRKLCDISPHVLRQRMIKEESEVQSIRKACLAVHSGHLAAVSALRPGISELELAAAVENAQRIAGHEGCFFLRSSDFVMSRGPLGLRPQSAPYERNALHSFGHGTQQRCADRSFAENNRVFRPGTGRYTGLRGRLPRRPEPDVRSRQGAFEGKGPV